MGAVARWVAGGKMGVEVGWPDRRRDQIGAKGWGQIGAGSDGELLGGEAR